MVRLRYTPLASVQVSHNFYKTGLCPDLTFTPTPATRQLLDTYEWVARPIEGKLLLMGREDEPGLPAIPITEPIRLTFVVQLTKTALTHISEGFETRGAFFFSNLAADGSAKTTLTAGPVLTANDRLPPVSGQRQTISLEKSKYKQLIIQQVVAGSGLQAVQQLPIAENQETLAIQVMQPGRYTFVWTLTDGSAPVMEEHYLSDAVANGPLPFGVLELVFGQTPPAPVAFTFTMQVRTRIWRYFLVDARTKAILIDADAAGNDADGNPALTIGYAPPPTAPAFPATLSATPTIDTVTTMTAQAVVLEAQTTDPTRTPAQQQTAKDHLRLLRSDLALMQTMQADNRVNAVYRALLPDPLPILDYAQPILKLQYSGKTDFLPIPTAETLNATIFYTI